MPVTAGVLDIISAVVGTSTGIFVFWLFLITPWWGEGYAVYLVIGLFLLLIIGAIAVIGGINAVKQRKWTLAIIGAIAAILSCVPSIWFSWVEIYINKADYAIWAFVLWSFACLFIIIPVSAITLTILARKQFERK